MHTSEGYCRDTFWDVVETPSLCDLGHQCPNSICPEELPGEEDACDIHQVVKCHYDKVECCDGSVEFSITAICSDHKWMLEMLPTYCDLSCHDDDQHIRTDHFCPASAPQSDTPCQVSEDSLCKYFPEECCEEIFYRVKAYCVDNNWEVVKDDQQCELPCDGVDVQDYCPRDVPQLFGECSPSELECVYRDDGCCHQAALCDGGQWIDMSYPPFCNEG